MKYLVLFNIDKVTKVLNEFSDKYNCLFFIENYVNSYLMSKQGDIDINKNIYQEPSYLRSLSWNKIPLGYVIMRNMNCIDGFTVFRKSLDVGILYNSTIINKIFTIQMGTMECDNKYYDINDYDLYDLDIDHLSIDIIKPEFNKCLDELLKKKEDKNNSFI